MHAFLLAVAWMFCASAEAVDDHALIQSSALMTKDDNEEMIQERCMEGWKKIPTCACPSPDSGKPILQCERCTIKKHCQGVANPFAVTSNLARDDCECEGGPDKPVLPWPKCESAPAVAITIVLDVSGSMQVANRIANVKKILPDLLHHFLRNKDSCAVITFASAPKVVLPLTSVSVVDDAVEADIQKALTAGGSTAIYDTLIEAVTESEKAPAGLGRIIALVSDGVDTASQATLDDAVKALKKTSLLQARTADPWPVPKVLSIGLNLNSQAGGIQQKIATETGGVFLNAADSVEDVQDKFLEMASTICDLENQINPTPSPSPVPTVSPSPVPTASPSPVPTVSPSPVPTIAPTPAPTPKGCKHTGWTGGECVNKPSNGGTTLAAASQTSCQSKCEVLQSTGCCYWKPKDSLCKFFAGATGDGAGAGGRYQNIIACS